MFFCSSWPHIFSSSEHLYSWHTRHYFFPSHHKSIIVCTQWNVSDNWRNFNMATILLSLAFYYCLLSVPLAGIWSCCKEYLFFLLSKANYLKLISLIHILMDKCVKTAGSKCWKVCVLRASWFIYVFISFLFLLMVSTLHHTCHTSWETELTFPFNSFIVWNIYKAY